MAESSLQQLAPGSSFQPQVSSQPLPPASSFQPPASSCLQPPASSQQLPPASLGTPRTSPAYGTPGLEEDQDRYTVRSKAYLESQDPPWIRRTKDSRGNSEKNL